MDVRCEFAMHSGIEHAFEKQDSPPFIYIYMIYIYHFDLQCDILLPFSIISAIHVELIRGWRSGNTVIVETRLPRNSMRKHV